VTFAMTIALVSRRAAHIRLLTSARLDSLCKATTLMMKPKLNTRTTTGSTLSPGLSSVYNLSIVPELPPAPALLVDVGRAFLTDSLWSAAARRRMAARGPPGEVARPPLTIDDEEALGLEVDDSGPDSAPEVSGEEGRAEA
jgi:hypothetical protein